MKKRILSVVVFCILHTNLAVAQQQERPNIIFILIDDQRYDFLSFLEHPWIKTPHIDELASQAMFFENAFVTTSLCSPSRASIMTGQYARVHKVMDNDTPLPKGTPTFPIELQKAGYQTAFLGKWHMGGENDMPRPGFDYWVSFKGQGDYYDPELNINGERIQREGYTTDLLTDYTVQFIEENYNKDQPYFLYLSHKAIHEDFSPAKRHEGFYEGLVIPRPETFQETEENYRGKPNWLKRQRNSWHGAERDFQASGYGSFDNFFQLYSEAMLSVDESVGRVTQTLKDLGELENTVVIYYSDNGYLMGEHGLIDKRVMYEESIRVPAFVHWPDVIQNPVSRQQMILNIDIGPTILDLAGTSIPSSMHGESFASLVKDEQSTAWRDAFVYEYFVDPNAVQTPTITGLRTDKYSYMTYQGVWDNYELYDLENDPHQRHNLLGNIVFGQQYGPFLRQLQRQDAQLFALVKKLDDKMKKLIKEND
ncbi:MAG: sulfatase [Bacteroidota bacterium]